jgi:predicted GNAT family N-acyltransferase
LNNKKEKRIEIQEKFSDAAKQIREQVFVKEQGFREEFDDIDKVATHLVMYAEDSQPIATCRIFQEKNENEYLLGRLAVCKEYRGKNIGSYLVREAEKYVRKKGGKTISLHAQCRVEKFYQKMGYVSFGEIDYDESCPHIWMNKIL